jgi:hypothetical protein
MADCPKRHACPHLGYQSCAAAQAETERLKVENRDLRRVFERATAAFQEKEAEIRRLKEEAEVLPRRSSGLAVRHLASGYFQARQTG